MAIEIARYQEAEDGSATGREWTFRCSSSVSGDTLIIACTNYAEVSRPSRRHRFKVVRRWDLMDERPYWSEIQRQDVPLPDDVKAEALRKAAPVVRVAYSDR